jgi:molybdopterin-binding protein
METLSVAQAARLLQLNPKRVQTLARSGRLPASRVGRKWLFRRDQLEALLGGPGPEPAPAESQPAHRAGGRRRPERSSPVEISARNQLRGRVLSVQRDGVMAEVRLRIGDQELVAVITRSSADRMGLRAGEAVLAVIKSTEVMIGRR